MTMGRQLVGRALTTRRAPRRSPHARGPLGTIARAGFGSSDARTVTHEAHRALHTNTSRHRCCKCSCCISRAFARSPLLLLAASTDLPLRRRQSQPATTAELQQLVGRCPGICAKQLSRRPPSARRWSCRQLQHRRLDGILGGRQPAAGVAGIPLDPAIRLTRQDARALSRPPRGASVHSSWGLIVDCT